MLVCKCLSVSTVVGHCGCLGLLFDVLRSLLFALLPSFLLNFTRQVSNQQELRDYELALRLAQDTNGQVEEAAQPAKRYKA